MNTMRAVSATLRWYKGNLHCHTYTSDGRAFPEQALARYREAGYDFCAITNHNRLGHETDFWRQVADGDTDMAYQVSRRNFDIYRASCPWAEIRDTDGATEVRVQPLDVVRARVVSDEQAPYYAAGNTAPMHPKFASAWTQPYRLPGA